MGIISRIRKKVIRISKAINIIRFFSLIRQFSPFDFVEWSEKRLLIVKKMKTSHGHLTVY